MNIPTEERLTIDGVIFRVSPNIGRDKNNDHYVKDWRADCNPTTVGGFLSWDYVGEHYETKEAAIAACKEQTR